MILNVKALKGEGCCVKADDSTATILDIKQQIEKELGITTDTQKLLFNGHTLNDDKLLSAYPNIKDGSKINLIVKKKPGLQEVMYRQFRRYYDDKLSERLAMEFMKDFERKMSLFSLDDLERLSGSILSE